MAPKPVFIYCLKDPATGDVRYIGKTDNIKKRLRAHLTSSSKEHNRLGNWLKSLASRGETPVLAILHEVGENELWMEEECRYISCARALGVELVNGTDGGDGASGRISTPESRAIMSASHIGVSKGPHSPETRAAMSAASKGVPKSPEHCASMSALWTPERRAAKRAAQIGVPHSPERCASIRAAWTPERRAAMSASQKGVPNSPEQNAAHSAAMTGRSWSPARRAAYERRWGSK